MNDILKELSETKECHFCKQLFLPDKEALGLMWQHACVPCAQKYITGGQRSRMRHEVFTRDSEEHYQ